MLQKTPVTNDEHDRSNDAVGQKMIVSFVSCIKGCVHYSIQIYDQLTTFCRRPGLRPELNSVKNADAKGSGHAYNLFPDISRGWRIWIMYHVAKSVRLQHGDSVLTNFD